MGEQDLQAQKLIVLGMDLEDVVEAMEMVVVEVMVVGKEMGMVEEMVEEMVEVEEMEVLVEMAGLDQIIIQHGMDPVE